MLRFHQPGQKHNRHASRGTQQPGLQPIFPPTVFISSSPLSQINALPTRQKIVNLRILLIRLDPRTDGERQRQQSPSISTQTTGFDTKMPVGRIVGNRLR